MRDERRHLILSASSIIGTKVKTPRDENIGEIKEIMLDTATGEVSYAVLSVSTGFLNMGSKYFAVAWKAFYFDTAQDDVIILDVSKERLEKSPGFDKDNWPAHADYEFIDSVYSYYGFERQIHQTF